MKTNMRSIRFVSLAIAIAAALVTQPMRASFIDTLLITENNSTSTGLTATLTTSSGTTSLNVTPGANPETWFITLTGFGGTQQFWAEPGAADLINFVQASTSQLGNIFVASENPSGGVTGIANNTSDFFTFSLDLLQLRVTFNDLGDAAAPTPDTGSTLALLSLSAVALLGATRLRFLQLAA